MKTPEEIIKGIECRIERLEKFKGEFDVSNPGLDQCDTGIFELSSLLDWILDETARGVGKE
jgi:hypothetical protein